MKSARSGWAVRPAAVRGAVAGVVLLGLVLRLVGIRGAFPYAYHPDEPTDLGVVLGMVRHPSLNPHFFRYPSLFFDVVALAEGIYVKLGELIGSVSSAASLQVPDVQTVGNAFIRDSAALVVARVVTLTASVALIAVAMWLCWLLTHRRAPMVLAGFLVAVNPILVRNGRWATPDTLAGLAATAAIAGCVLVARNPCMRSYLLAGVLIGVATSAKYNAAVVIVALLAAHWIAHERPTAQLGKLVAAGLAAAAAFLVITPFAMLDWHEFYRDATYDVGHYRGGHAGHQGDSLVTNLSWLWGSIGLVLLLPLGAIFVRRSRRLLLVPLSFVVVYFALLSSAFVRFERNLVPLLPALLVVAAVGGIALVERLASRRAARLSAVGLLALVVVWPLVFAIRDAHKATQDTRASARNWIDDNMPVDSTIVVDAYSPWVDPARYQPVPLGFSVVDKQQVERAAPDAVVFTANGSGRFLAGGSKQAAAEETLAWLHRASCDQATFNRGGDRIRIFRLRC